jgi:hypothetical protein
LIGQFRIERLITIIIKELLEMVEYSKMHGGGKEGGIVSRYLSVG